MRYEYKDKNNGVLILNVRETVEKRSSRKEQQDGFLTLAWNCSRQQTVVVDEIPITVPPHHFITFMSNQSYAFERPADIVMWQYNSNFYCIIEHDQEVSCVGFLFYGHKGSMLIQLSEKDRESFGLLLRVFEEEFKEKDNIQGEMLRVMLKRLIIKLTRLAKAQYLPDDTTQPALDIIRKYSLLVENNFRKLHQVQDYADLMHKSPKTLANLFALQNQPSPLQIILERIALEARRMLIYTDKSASEIAYELGFEELAHFSRLFKNTVGQTPTEYRQLHKNTESGSIDK